MFSRNGNHQAGLPNHGVSFQYAARPFRSFRCCLGDFLDDLKSVYTLSTCIAIIVMLTHNFLLLSNKRTNNSVWTKGLNPEMKTHVPPPAKDITYLAEIDDIEPWTLVELTSNIQSLLSQKAIELDKPSNYYTIVGCIAGGEAGVDMADALSEHIGVLSNGTQGDFCNRRDKKVQQELVRRTGMRAVRQDCGSKWEDVVDFLMSESFPVVRTHNMH